MITESKNSFNFLKSKIRELRIPLPNFNYFHKPSSEEDVFENYIGREEISEQLEEWLTSGDSGSYLVTGYRGMGKSSFVGKVLNKITEKTKNNFKILWFTACCSLFIISSVLLFFIWSIFDDFAFPNYTIGIPETFKEWVMSILLISIVVGLFILIRDRIKKYWHNPLKRKWCKKIDKTDYENYKTWFEKVFKIKDVKKNKHNLVIQLNLGHETLKEKDILSLIAKRIYNTYKQYLNDFYTNWKRMVTKTISLLVVSILIVWFLDKINIVDFLPHPISSEGAEDNSSDIYCVFYKFIKDFATKGSIINLKEHWAFFTPIFIAKIVSVFIFYFLLRRLWDFLIFYIPFLHKHSTKAVLEQLQFLNDRIEAAVTEDSGPNRGYTHSTSLFSFNVSRRKNKTYPNASTREIEDELIQILDKIQSTGVFIRMSFKLLEKLVKTISRSYKKIHQTPKFIIVFDELDKIDPVYNNAVKVEQELPEFEASTSFQGGSAIRNRRQNVLKLLGNMKLFMSQAKAKFVFISGRELYDAFLADLADREFAASSIFNGVIYVDSFLESSTKQKNILSKSEEYICGYLIPEEWYKQTVKEQYYQEKGETSLHHKLENKTYRQPNLKIYKKFLIKALIKNKYVKTKWGKKIKLFDRNFENYKEFKREVEESIIGKFDWVIYIWSGRKITCIKDIERLTETLKDREKLESKAEKREKSILKITRLVHILSLKRIPCIRNKIELLKEIREKNFENDKGFKNNISKYEKIIYEETITDKSLFEEQLHEIEQIFLYIDKVIVFLNQFSIYLTHICNGSPKKITIYFEQYIKQYISKHPKNPFSNSNDKDIKKTKYCLSFTATDQQNIGFINYVTYPIVQSVINQTSHFSDKMLVSIAFLIDHIFKHHKGGFSHEHIEHTPELLEVYHIPDLRNTIAAILSFLHQNHITDICGGVYNYKFRKSIADEIMYNSRISEEISAIFNFTLDESLPIKRYYYRLVKENERKYLTLEERIRNEPVINQYATTLASQLETLAEIHLLDDEHNEAIQYFQAAFEIIKAELQKYKEKDIKKEEKGENRNRLHLYVLLIRTVLKLGLSKECKGYYNEAFVIYNTLLDYLVEFRYLNDGELGLKYFYEDNILTEKHGEEISSDGEWKAKKIKLYHSILTKTEDCKEDNFYKNEILPFYRSMEYIQNEKIDFFIDSDYTISGLSKALSPKKQEIISRLTVFSEVKYIFQAILTNLFVIEKIGANGITQENLDLAEDQFKYIYLLTDSKDKFIQAADFYKKLASILFLKNYSNPKRDEYLQMWGFDIYEVINEFCFIHHDEYNKMIAYKFPKEILKEFFIDEIENLWKVYMNVDGQTSEVEKVKRQYILKIKEKLQLKEKIYRERISTIEKRIEKTKIEIKNIKKQFKEQKNEEEINKLNGLIRQEKNLKEQIEPKEKELEQLIKQHNKEENKIKKLIDDFIPFGREKRDKYFRSEELIKGKKCYEHCLKRQFNHPCYACSYVSKSLDIFMRVFKAKYKGLFENISPPYKTRESYFFKFFESFKQDNSKINSNYLFVLASALRIKADTSLSCINGDNNKLTFVFLKRFLSFLKDYYDNDRGTIIIDEFIADIEKDMFSKLEKTILYYWLSAEYFYLNNSPVDSSECLTTILVIFDKYITINDELNISTGNPFINLFDDISETIVRRVLRSSNNANNYVNHIEIQNLKFILRNSPTRHINLANLSTTANIEELLFSYCKLELTSIPLGNNKAKDSIYAACYQSTLLSPNQFSSTIHEKILSMEFKEKMNMAIFKIIFEEAGGKRKLNFYTSNFQIKYFFFLEEYCTIDTDIINRLHKLKIIPKHIENNIKSRIDFLLFLISDSLYCLTQIIEVLSSGRFSNFSHSFIGDIYCQISKWATLYHLTRNILPKYHTHHESDLNIFINSEIGTMKRRSDEYSFHDLSAGFRNNVQRIYKIISKHCKDKAEVITDRIFETNVLNDIGTGNRHFLVSNYSAAMALRYYHKAMEVHHEGKEYREMIRKMYIIDDDVSNGMHNFSLALERYTMNCGVIKEKMEKLRKYYKGSLSYPLINYLKDPSEINNNK